MKKYTVEFKRSGTENWLSYGLEYDDLETAKKIIREMKRNDFKAKDEDGYEYRIVEKNVIFYAN